MVDIVKSFDLNKVLRVAHKINEEIEDKKEVVEIINILKDGKSLANALNSTNESLKREIKKNKECLEGFEKMVREMEAEANAKAEITASEIQKLGSKLEEARRDNRIKLDAEIKSHAEAVATERSQADDLIKKAKEATKEANKEALDATTKKQKAEQELKTFREKTLSMTS